MNRISALLVRSRKRIRNFVKGSFGRLKPGGNTGANGQDILRTSLTALSTCSAAYPPLNGVVSALVAICEISERMALSKKDAHELARHSVDLLRILAQATEEPGGISESTLASIACFESTLTEIQSEMAQLVDRTLLWRLTHLNRTERALRNINRRIDEASRAFAIGSAARTEASLYQITQILHSSTGPPTLRNKIFIHRAIIVMQCFFVYPPFGSLGGPAGIEMSSASRFTFNRFINMLATDTRVRGMSSIVHNFFRPAHEFRYPCKASDLYSTISELP
ncbi:hypothetical protein B0H12DRAFT_1109790 [Mycena haematopus]|nr:hypothetical protein B0H12DRAFT_1109790 [Mycena haematopus]